MTSHSMTTKPRPLFHLGRMQCTRKSHAQYKSEKLTGQLRWRMWRSNANVVGIRYDPRISKMIGLYGIVNVGTLQWVYVVD